MDPPQDLLEKGFQLAYFLARDRAAALEAVGSAANKLKARSLQEGKRIYWRDKHLKRHITKISREEAATFQWLIFLESDRDEIRQEISGSVGKEDLILRYIKSLVRITSGRSSFYVNVGLQRLLYNYSTAEAQRIYEGVSNRYLGADEYRRAKLVVMRKLKARFGNLLRIVRSEHGEFRFEHAEGQRSWAAFVEQCLRWFTPWTAAGDCPPFPQGSVEFRNSRPESRAAGSGDDALESARCHLLIHPHCSQSLLASLGLWPSAERLALPKFFLDGGPGGGPPPANRAPSAPLTPEERKALWDHLSAESDSRARSRPGTLRFVVDGAECMHCPALTDAQTRFSIPAESDLVEIWLDSEHSKVLLGVHMLRRDAADSMGPSEAVIPFGGQNNLRLAISALPVERGRLLTVSVCCEPATLGHWWRNSWRCFADWAASAPQYALSGFAILFVASVMTAFYAVRSNVASRRSDARLQQELAASRKQAVDLQREIESRRDSATLSAYRLVPDEAIVRGAANSQVPSIGISTQPGLIRLELRVHGASHPFQAQLRTFSTRRLLLSQEQLAPVEISGGAVLVFDCPSAIFRPRASYVIELSTVAKSGVRETVSSFTFQTTDRE